MVWLRLKCLLSRSHWSGWPRLRVLCLGGLAAAKMFCVWLSLVWFDRSYIVLCLAISGLVWLQLKCLLSGYHWFGLATSLNVWVRLSLVCFVHSRNFLCLAITGLVWPHLKCLEPDYHWIGLPQLKMSSVRLSLVWFGLLLITLASSKNFFIILEIID